ncbi:bacterial transcriptional activator domain-containing protein [Planomonospora sp. ID82291]|uniref:bacterial transcriptional activator domain-containing protein n=1 Tax=Planomonospora sp. ID82291 TaxID=2738136 RepID=UPI0018C3B900|nr:bacterial transcriptional activator domain-containing protein [Planomonospora sp. ID82291]MBG0814877.1 tetratricopeptide repeat protein [Planomonospora sp. ID82291]
MRKAPEAADRPGARAADRAGAGTRAAGRPGTRAPAWTTVRTGLRRAGRAAGRAVRVLGAVVLLSAVEAGLPVALVRLGGPPTLRIPRIPREVPSWEEVRRMLSGPLPDDLPYTLLTGGLWLLWAAFTVALLTEAAVAARGVEIRLPLLGPLRTVAERLLGVLAAAAPPPGPRSAGRRRPSTIVVAAAGEVAVAAGDSWPTAPMRRITLEQDATDPGGLPPASRARTAQARVARDRRPSFREASPAAHPGVPPAAHREASPVACPEASPVACPEASPVVRPAVPLVPVADGRRDPVHVSESVPVHVSESVPSGASVVATPSGGAVSPAFAAGISTAYATVRFHRHRRRRIPPPASIGPETVSGAGTGPEIRTETRAGTEIRTETRAGTEIRTGAGAGAGVGAGTGVRAGTGREGGPEEEPEPAPVVGALRRAHLRTYADRGKESPADADLVREAFSLDVPDRLLAGHRDDRTGVEVELAGLSLGLMGPGAVRSARAIVLDLLRQAGRFRAEVVVRTADARELFGPAGSGWEASAGAVPGLTVVESADAAVDRFTEAHFSRRRMLIERGAADVAELRERDPGEVLPAVLLVASVTEEIFDWDVAALLASSARTGTGALLLGDWPPGTTWEVGADGRIGEVRGAQAEGLLGARLFGLSARDGGDCLRLLAEAAAGDGDGDGDGGGGGGDDGGGGGGDDGGGGRGDGGGGEDGGADVEGVLGGCGARGPGREQAGVDGLPVWEGPEPVRLSILGRPVVQAKGRPGAVPVDGPRLLLLVLLALHPEGLRTEEIRTALWPGTTVDACVHDTLRSLRDALRAATDGADRGRRDSPFIVGDGGTYRIEPAMVAVDLWDFEAVVGEARTAADDRSRIDALDCAARLCRGTLAEGLAAGWLDDRRNGQREAQAGVLVRLAELRASGDPRGALDVLERAVALDPDPEDPWRRLIRLQLELGHRDRAAETAVLLRRRLCAMGVRPTRETERLLSEL